MEQVIKGKHAAFQELYKRYGTSLYRYFYMRMWKDKEKAEDFVQDIMTKIIQKPDSFDTSRKFKTWVFSVANNMIINEYKKQAVREGTKLGIEDHALYAASSQDVASEVHESQFQSELKRELGQLDEKHREVFELRHVVGFSVKEIAEILGINEGTVKSRAFYAIKKLSERLAHFNPSFE